LNSCNGRRTQAINWHPGADLVTGWSPDGTKVILQSSGREVMPTQESNSSKFREWWYCPRNGCSPAVKEKLLADGKHMALPADSFFGNPEWRNHRGVKPSRI